MTETRIYVNSYMMKTSGDDTRFEVQLGATYNFNQIQLDSAIIENQFLNFYESWTTDFRVLGVTIAGNTYQITIDQHVTWQQLIQYVNNNPIFQAGVVRIVDVPLAFDDGRRVLQCQFTRNGVVVNSTLVGGAWEKLGFNIGVLRQVHASARCYDLSQSPSILLSFENIPNVMKSKYGQYSFIIPNNSTFGSRIYYQNTQEKSCQSIKLPYEISTDRFNIQLLNCDLKKLETASQNGQKNNQGIECIFVFTLRKE